jgi:DNA adenine methylase
MKNKNDRKTPISYYGGKQSMLGKILPLIPAHVVYVEPFFGGGAVFWAKDKSDVEVINDLNGHVVNFYKQLKNRPDELIKLVESTPYARSSYKQAMVVYNAPYLFDELTRAWAFWVATIQGFSNKIGSWRCAQNRNKECKLLENKKELISEQTSERLKFVQIESKDAVQLIKRHDAPEVFFYLDPPYVDSNQGHYGGYTQDHFNELLEALRGIKGKFLLSSYPNQRLKELTDSEGWNSIGNNMPLSASNQSGRRKVEMLTFNYDLDNV